MTVDFDAPGVRHQIDQALTTGDLKTLGAVAYNLVRWVVEATAGDKGRDDTVRILRDTADRLLADLDHTRAALVAVAVAVDRRHTPGPGQVCVPDCLACMVLDRVPVVLITKARANQAKGEPT